MKTIRSAALPIIQGNSMDENDELGELANVIVGLPHGKTKTLAELVAGWKVHVIRLRDDSRPSAAITPFAWGAHDYVAALNLRSLVSQGIAQASSEVQDRARSIVASSDEILISYTEPDVNEVVERFAGERHPEHEWWWGRIPVVGPIRDEFLRVVGQ